MDPISVAASIAGLLGAASKISSILNTIVTNAKTAPKLAQNVQTEISDISACLHQLQEFVSGAQASSESHENLIMVEQLVAILSNCVLTFSELEETMDSLKPHEPMQNARMLLWSRKEQTVSLLLARLQSSKMSLNLMLTTLTWYTSFPSKQSITEELAETTYSKSMREAQASVAKLTTLMHDISADNQRMVQMMTKLEPNTSRWSWSTTAPSLNRVDMTKSNVDSEDDAQQLSVKNTTMLYPEIPEATDGEDTQDDDQALISDNGSVVTVKPAADEIEKEASESLTPIFNFTFDEDLNNSRPYARARGRQMMWSAASSAIHTLGWSHLSGTSLADVSQISVLGLPITRRDLWNGERYSAEQITYPKPISKAEKPFIAVGYESRIGLPSKRASAPTLSLLSPLNLFNNQIQSLVHRRSLRGSAKARNIGTELVLIGVPFSSASNVYKHLRIRHGPFDGPLKAHEPIMRDLIEAFKPARRYASPLDPSGTETFNPEVSEHRDETFLSDLPYRSSATLHCLRYNMKVRGIIKKGKAPDFDKSIPYFVDNIVILFMSHMIRSDDLLIRVYNSHARLDNVALDLDYSAP